MKRLICCCLLALSGILCAQETAQPPLPTATLTIGARQITAEIADNDQERMAGLMFRKNLASDSGMLFLMPRPERATFWMKNTTIPLSVAYLNASGVILEIHNLKPLDETPVRSNFPTIAYALEMEQGWFDKNGVLPGDRMTGLPAPGN